MATLAVAALLVVALLPGAASTPLFDQDEAAYAGFARGMARGEGWVLHDFPLSEIHRKPPLALWLMALSFRLLGEGFLSLRLPGMLAVALSVGITARLGARLFGPERGQCAALLLAGSLVPLFGRVALVDPVLLLGMSLALLGLALRLDGERAGSLWVGLGLGVGLLAKGPAAALILGLNLPALVLAHPQGRRLLGLDLLLALLLAPVPLLLWGWRAWQEDGGATVRWMLDWYLLRRTQGAVLGQTGPPGTYLLLFLLFALPWSGLLVQGLVEAVRRRREPGVALLLLWLPGAWLGWELLASKLPAYSLTAWPALALLAAGPLLEGRIHRAAIAGSLLISLALGLGLLGASLGLEPGRGLPGLAMTGLLLILLPSLGWGLVLRGRAGLGLGLVLGTGPLALAAAFLFALPELRPRLHPTFTVAQAVAALAPQPSTVQLSAHWRLPSLVWYLEGQGHQVQLLPTKATPDPAAGVWILPSPPAGGEERRRVEIDGWIPDKGQRTRFGIYARPSPPAAPSTKESGG